MTEYIAVNCCYSCKDYQNLNSFFAVVMGLSNIAVSRLSQTWEVCVYGRRALPEVYVVIIIRSCGGRNIAVTVYLCGGVSYHYYLIK